MQALVPRPQSRPTIERNGCQQVGVHIADTPAHQPMTGRQRLGKGKKEGELQFDADTLSALLAAD